jgi:hypothetical protein
MQLERAGAGRAAAGAVLRRAVGAGVNHIDTAGFYGSVNGVIRAALAPYPEGLVLATKVGAVRTAGGQLVAAQRPEQLREQVEENLSSLGVGQVAVVNLRRLDAPPGIVAEGDQKVGLADQLAELVALREAGKIGGIAWVPFFPLGSAFPGRPKAGDDPVVAAIAAELGATAAQVALAWLLTRYDRTLLIPGTADAGHLAENLGAGRIELPAAARAALDRLA